MKRNLLIIGAGGHGKVTAESAEATGRWDRIRFLDDRYGDIPEAEWPVIGKVSDAPSFREEFEEVFVAIGDNPLRIRLLRDMIGLGYRPATIVHPTAHVSRYARIEAGTVVMARAAVTYGARIGFGCIVNTGVTVDHECAVGMGVHLSPGVHLAGNVRIGDCTWIGIGSSVIQQIRIGRECMVGAGTVVIRNVPDGATVVGVPARIIKTKQHSEFIS